MAHYRCQLSISKFKIGDFDMSRLIFLPKTLKMSKKAPISSNLDMYQCIYLISVSFFQNSLNREQNENNKNNNKQNKNKRQVTNVNWKKK